jgi:putative ABC transport system substrate-binding protein
MRRRELIALLGGAVAWPFRVFAQEAGRTYRIAYLEPAPRGIPAHLAFFKALSKLGFVEGKNLEVDASGFAQRPGQFVQAAEKLVRAKPDLILCGGPDPGRAAQQATKTIPLLVITDDMAGEGFVASIARPGGNTTGISIHSPELDGKRFEILLELIPGARGVDALAGSDTANAQHFQALREEAGARGVQLVIRTVMPMRRSRRPLKRRRPPEPPG